MCKRIFGRTEIMGKSSGIDANVYDKAECRWYKRSFVSTNVKRPPQKDKVSSGKSSVWFGRYDTSKEVVRCPGVAINGTPSKARKRGYR
jgi:hypothetical protein